MNIDTIEEAAGRQDCALIVLSHYDAEVVAKAAIDGERYKAYFALNGRYINGVQLVVAEVERSFAIHRDHQLVVTIHLL
jgi:hypothetical protein